jgi:hypothetical protein|tara:strand:- start:170 stop:748 length:579 start_codon:yes stop_codon:yes gene_type:complete
MSVSINVMDNEESAPPTDTPDDGVTINVVEKDAVEAKLKLRSSINGDLMIMDHKDIDIVIKQADKKIVAFAKETLSDLVYGAEARLFEYLRKNGLVEIDSIQGGNIYGSLEAKLQEGDKVIEIALLKIAEWMDGEEPMTTGRTGYDDMQDDHLLEPDGEYSTELGEVPAAEEKGSINQSTLFAPYMYGRYAY